MDNKIISKKLEANIKDELSADKMAFYWHRRKKILAPEFPQVNWVAIGRAMKKVPTHRRRYVVQHASGICGVNTMRKRWKDREDDACPRCGQPENARHVFLCKDEAVQLLWQAELDELEIWLEKYRTDPHLRNAIIHNLRAMYQGAIPNNNRSSIESAQDTLGWESLIEGFIHNEWCIQQQQYFESIGSKRGGLRWVTALLEKLWQISWNFWDKRNKVEHKVDRAQMIRDFDAQIMIEIGKGCLDIPRDDHFFTPAELAHVQGPATMDYKRSWLRNVGSARAKALDQALPDPSLIPMQRMMRQYFYRQGT